MRNLNYTDRVRDIDISSPVFIAMSEHDKRKWAENRLMEELEKGRKSAEEFGWISEEEADRLIESL